jgi:murein DD-endopeptidase MepM/ murein hydrolase activator NlpD
VDRTNTIRARASRAQLAALSLTFSVGLGAGLLTYGSLEQSAVPLPQTDLVPAAGLPDADPGAITVDFAGIALPVVLPAPGASTVLPRNLPEARPAATIPLQAGPRLAALLPAPDAGGSLAHGATHREEARAVEKAALPLRHPRIEAVTVARGDTLMDILLRAGIERQEAHEAVGALRGVYDPRRLQAGQALEITALDDDAAPRRLVGLAFDISFEHEVQVSRGGDGGFASLRVERPQQRRLVHRANLIDDSLYLAADRVQVPQDITLGLIKLFSWDVDFQRDFRAGDGFETLFEEVTLEDDERLARGGDLLYARLTLQNRELDAYRFELRDDTVEYYDRTGRSLRKFLLRTPVDGARMSSGFGMRRHPILGYSRMHKGTDFAAPTGTPIYAAGSGTVERAGRNGGYGHYVRVRHNGEYSTAYAHLSRYAKGIRAGARVRQGQVIGYVGTTGRSTGPHLHYEVLRAGGQINPLSLKHPPASQLAGADLERFHGEMARIDRLRAELAGGTQVASKSVGPTNSAVR